MWSALGPVLLLVVPPLCRLHANGGSVEGEVHPSDEASNVYVETIMGFSGGSDGGTGGRSGGAGGEGVGVVPGRARCTLRVVPGFLGGVARREFLTGGAGLPTSHTQPMAGSPTRY